MPTGKGVAEFGAAETGWFVSTPCGVGCAGHVLINHTTTRINVRATAKSKIRRRGDIGCSAEALSISAGTSGSLSGTIRSGQKFLVEGRGIAVAASLRKVSAELCSLTMALAAR